MAPVIPSPAKIREFACEKDFELWLQKHHDQQDELWLKIHKKASGRPTVTYAEEDGMERTVTILGIDEADNSLQQISWISPVARALLKAREGDEVTLQTPAGLRTLEILRVEYPVAAPR